MAGIWRRPADGARLSEDAALGALVAAPVALLGERHDSAGDHAWQRRVLQAIVERAGDVTVGFEMFPRRVQPVLDAWVAGEIAPAAFLEATGWREVWGFAPELYRGLFELCRARRLPMLALNVDRPLVGLIGREGWAALPAGERDWLSPAAPAAMDYRRYLFEITGGARPGRAATGPGDPAFDRFVRAQQVWDRAFACAIAEHLAARPGARVVGIIGRGHLEFGFGTPAQLRDLGVGGVVTALPGAGPAPPGAPAIADLVWSRSCDAAWG